jgi:hypothetical protein
VDEVDKLHWDFYWDVCLARSRVACPMTKHPKSTQLGGGVATNEDHPMAICILPYHQMLGDIKFCLTFLMFGHGNVR